MIENTQVPRASARRNTREERGVRGSLDEREKSSSGLCGLGYKGRSFFCTLCLLYIFFSIRVIVLRIREVVLPSVVPSSLNI